MECKTILVTVQFTIYFLGRGVVANIAIPAASYVTYYHGKRLYTPPKLQADDYIFEIYGRPALW